VIDPSCLYERWLPDGRAVFVMPLSFGRARIGIGNQWGVDDAW